MLPVNQQLGLALVLVRALVTEALKQHPLIFFLPFKMLFLCNVWFVRGRAQNVFLKSGSNWQTNNLATSVLDDLKHICAFMNGVTLTIHVFLHHYPCA